MPVGMRWADCAESSGAGAASCEEAALTTCPPEAASVGSQELDSHFALFSWVDVSFQFEILETRSVIPALEQKPPTAPVLWKAAFFSADPVLWEEVSQGL